MKSALSIHTALSDAIQQATAQSTKTRIVPAEVV